MNDASNSRAESRVAIVLVNYNGWRDTIECLDTLVAQEYPNFHIFVVDNDSQDESVENILEWCERPVSHSDWRELEGIRRFTSIAGDRPIAHRLAPSNAPSPLARVPNTIITVIRSGANLGFAAGCNLGMTAAGGEDFDYFWLLNTDTVVAADALTKLVCRAQTDPHIGMTGSTIRYYHRPGIVQALAGGYFDARRMVSRHIYEGHQASSLAVDVGEVEARLSYIMGASMLVSRNFVLTVGLMREDYFLYFEEIDWAIRASNSFRLAFSPESRVFHKSGASSSKKLNSFSTGYWYRNRVRFASRFFPERLWSVRIGLLLDLTRHILRGHWVHVRLILTTLWSFKALQDSVNERAPPPFMRMS